MGRIAFSKVHGLGNDFMVVDAVRQAISFTPAQIRGLADRRLGVGFDQLLLVEASERPSADFRYRIFNADGQPVQQCGNGARCLVRFVRRQGLTDRREITVETAGGMIRPRELDNGDVEVDMGSPRFAPPDIPFSADRLEDRYALDVNGERLSVGAVSMGNPHCVVPVAALDDALVARLGPAIEAHPRFTERVNAGFMHIVSRREIALRVYERGVGETPACGTGACAAVVVGRRWGEVDDCVRVRLRGGELTIHWDGGAASPVLMRGPAQFVFDGQITL